MPVSDKLFGALACGARAAISDAWHTAQRFSKSPDEVDHIYALLRFGIPGIVQHWSGVLRSHGIALRVTGVFCHQTPQAHYDHPTDGRKHPELGDLLIVHEHNEQRLVAAPSTRRRALLVQAKMADAGIPSSGKVDQYQEYLYEHWPNFELKGRGPRGESFIAGLRDLRPGDDGGRYGLVERHVYRTYTPLSIPFCLQAGWTFSEARKPVRTAGGEDAGYFLANMLFDTHWRRGRTGVVPSKPLALSTGTPNNHFDVTVQELLELTAKRTLGFRNKGYIGGTREEVCVQESSGDAWLLSTTGGLFRRSDVEGGREPPIERGKPDFNDGISLLLIETGGE